MHLKWITKNRRKPCVSVAIETDQKQMIIWRGMAILGDINSLNLRLLCNSKRQSIIDDDLSLFSWYDYGIVTETLETPWFNLKVCIKLRLCQEKVKPFMT